MPRGDSIPVDALISARRRCTIASFPSWFGLALTLGFATLSLFSSGLSVPGKVLFLCVGLGLAVPLFLWLFAIRVVILGPPVRKTCETRGRTPNYLRYLPAGQYHFLAVGGESHLGL
jgi:hypothetical protein